MTHTRTYLVAVRHVLSVGRQTKDRTGVGTVSVPGVTMRFDLSDMTIPLVTAKKVPYQKALVELEWMFKGRTDTKFLHDRGVRTWDPWAKPDGDLGPVYGYQWRSFNGRVDQLAYLVAELEKPVPSRRAVMSAWNPEQIADMALPPCHTMFQFLRHDDRLSLIVTQRSLDLFLGAPWDVFEFGVFLRVMASAVSLRPADLVWQIGDAHVYLNHIDYCHTMLDRHLNHPRPDPILALERPQADLRGLEAFERFTSESVEVTRYNPHPPIKAPIAV